MSENTGVLEAKTIRMATSQMPIPRALNNGGSAKGQAKERLKKLEEKAFRETKSVPGVSVFAILGTVAISALMVLVVLAQIYYNETAGESVRLSAEIRELTEKHRTLSLAFESSFDIREVERIAKDELGMSRPEAEQIITISVPPRDAARVVIGETEDNPQGFTAFIKSLMGYFTSGR